MNPIFTKLNKQRYSWAYQAKIEFINRFALLEVEEIRKAANKELTIAVYGATQVGKTSVILSLLGIKQEKMTVLSKWLRGKRRLGVSSTSTVTRYERSKDSNFHIYIPNGKKIKDIQGEQLETVLHSIREEIESGNTFSVEPVVIQIPIEYFEEKDNNLQIIDLPGVESADWKEVEHVNSCINHWLPLSEVCLLIEDASQLTTFTQYTLRSLNNWHNQLENFRIIPTRALSLDSIRKKIKNRQISKKEELIEDYEIILNRVLGTELNLADIIYPFDIGDSSEELKTTDASMYEKTKGMMQELMDKLIIDLQTLDVNELSFSRLTRLYNEAETASKEDLAKNNLQNDQLKKEVDMNEKLLIHEQESYKNLKDKQTKKIDKTKILMRQLKYLISSLNSIDIDELVKESYPMEAEKKKVNEINDFGIRFQNKLEKILEDETEGLKKQLFSSGLIKIEEWKSVHWFPLDVTNKKLNIFLTNKSSQKVLGDMRDQAIEEGVRVCKDYVDQLNTFFNKAKKRLKNQENLQNGACYRFEKFNEKIKNRIAMSESELLQNMEKHAVIAEMWERDCKHAAQLKTYFINHWLIYKSELQEYLLKGSYYERWYIVSFLQLHYQDGKRIIDSLTNVR